MHDIYHFLEETFILLQSANYKPNFCFANFKVRQYQLINELPPNFMLKYPMSLRILQRSTTKLLHYNINI